MRWIRLLLLTVFCTTLGLGAGCDKKEKRKATFEGPDKKFEIEIETHDKD